MVIEESKLLKDKLKNIIEDRDFENKFDPISVNNGVPFTFNQVDYNVKEGKPIYTDSNKIGKSGSATAIISPNTICIYTSDRVVYPKPINWEKLNKQKKIHKNGKLVNIFEKCHIIGYRLSAKFTSPHNIFIGTEKLNTGAMSEIESDIKKDVMQEKRKYLYKVTPLYRFKMDIIPFGVLFEYETIDNKEKKTYCKFCYNIEEGKKINYYDGGDIRIEDIPKREDDIIKQVNERLKVRKKDTKSKNYYLDIRKKEFHMIYDEIEKCDKLKGVPIKYIHEVNAKKEEILEKNEGFKICRKCEKLYNIRVN